MLCLYPASSAIKNGWTKIGFTERDVNVRIAEQLHTAGLKPNICWHLPATYRTEPFGNFTDKDFHLYLKKLGFERERSTEWFKIDPNIAKSNYNDFTENHGVVNDATDIDSAHLPFFDMRIQSLQP